MVPPYPAEKKARGAHLKGLAYETGSFRDPTSRVFYLDGKVCRYLDASALEEWRAVRGARFFREAMSAGRIVQTREWESTPAPLPVPWAGVLEHAPVAVISYPYEWPFGMLKRAALSHLDLLAAALDEGFILRDCSPFNIQWNGMEATFIDVPSFARLRPGDPWAGYGQFCRLFLYPLLLEAYRGLPFQPWLRSRLDGVPAAEMAAVLGWREFWKPGVFFDVFLQARLEAGLARSSLDARREFRAAGFSASLIRRNIRRLSRVLEGLRPSRSGSAWSDYRKDAPYSSDEYKSKQAFVRQAFGGRRRKIVWDLGCNDGDFSVLAAPFADVVVAMDADPIVVDRLYHRLSGSGPRNVLPLVMDLANPSPAQGWRGAERKSLFSRRKPETVLALALLHHLVITGNVPLEEAVSWLASLGDELILEFVSREDPMVQRLLVGKDDACGEYRRERFEAVLAECCVVKNRIDLAAGRRWLYHAVPRSLDSAL